MDNVLFRSCLPGVLLGVLLAATGCASLSRAPAAGTVTLLRYAPPKKPGLDAVMLTAAYEGQLFVRDGCVHMRSRRGGHVSVPVMPRNHQLWIRDGKGLGVMDGTGNTLAFGVNARFGGGELSHLPDAALETPAPPGCRGPLNELWVSWPDN